MRTLPTAESTSPAHTALATEVQDDVSLMESTLRFTGSIYRRRSSAVAGPVTKVAVGAFETLYR